MLRDHRGNRPRRARRTALAVLAAMVVAAPAAAEDAGEAALAALESRLMDAGRVEVKFDVRAVGAVQAALTGSATIGPGNDARIGADGQFAGAPAAITLSANAETMSGGNGDMQFETDIAPALREGLVIGLVRMGLLHNLAVLSGGAPPDRIDGTIREWVTYRDVTVGPGDDIGGVATRRFQFTVVVGGEPAAIADLWVDAGTGLPVRRVQVVNFAEGEMRVLEQYPRFAVDDGG